MHLSQLCQRDILTLSAEAPVRKAAEMMRVHHVGALALTDPEDPTRVVGVVTGVTGVLTGGNNNNAKGGQAPAAGAAARRPLRCDRPVGAGACRARRARGRGHVNAEDRRRNDVQLLPRRKHDVAPGFGCGWP